MKNDHYFAILKKTNRRVKLVELVKNTPKRWKDFEFERLKEKYSGGIK